MLTRRVNLLHVLLNRGRFSSRGWPLSWVGLSRVLRKGVTLRSVIGDTTASPVANFDAMDPAKQEDRTMAHVRWPRRSTPRS